MSIASTLVTGLVAIALVYFLITALGKRKKPVSIKQKDVFPESWQKILMTEVPFYNSLNQAERLRFEERVLEFINTTKITGIKTTVEDIDKVLVGASAIIPIFGFDKWKYDNIYEVILYPDSFNEDFETEGPNDRRILGMVGTGYMEDTMILSKKALRIGFQNETDKKNTAIHEFVHLIDKADGLIDGIPKLLMEKQYAIPWINMMNLKMDEIYDQKSDINPYAGTNRAEFFSVTAEYFFERPKLLEKKHPELYALMEEIFNHDLSERNLQSIDLDDIQRNDPCFCGSGKKFKHCCIES